MSVKLDIFNAIVAKLSASVPEVKTVKIWNNQPAKETEEKPKGYPAVFVHYSAMLWDQTSLSPGSSVSRKSRNQEQKGVFEVSLHCVFSYLEDETASFEAMDTLLDKIYSYISGLSGSYYGPLKRIGEEQDVDHDRLVDHVEVFSTGVQQCGFDDEAFTKIPGGTIELAISKELDIDNPIIRTGDGTWEE